MTSIHKQERPPTSSTVAPCHHHANTSSFWPPTQSRSHLTNPSNNPTHPAHLQKNLRLRPKPHPRPIPIPCLALHPHHPRRHSNLHIDGTISRQHQSISNNNKHNHHHQIPQGPITSHSPCPPSPHPPKNPSSPPPKNPPRLSPPPTSQSSTCLAAPARAKALNVPISFGTMVSRICLPAISSGPSKIDRIASSEA